MRAVLLMVLVAACKKDAAPPPVAQPSAKPSEPPKVVHRANVQEGFVVVVPKGGNVSAIEKLVRDRFAAVKLEGDVQPMDAPKMDRSMMKVGNPDLTDAELDQIQHGSAIAVSATGEPIATLRALTPIVRDAAVAGHAWVIDPTGGFASTAEQFATRRVAGELFDVRTQMQVHGVGGEGDQPFADTMGMPKLGFPELMVATTTAGQLTQLTVLIDATAQTMIAHPDLSVPGTIDVDLANLPGDWGVDAIRKNGGTARAKWLTRWGTGEGHAEQVIELVPPTGTGTEGIAAMLQGCFGKDPDQVIGARADDPELEAAARRARKELLAMRPTFVNDGVPAGEVLRVKAPFTENDQTEWMWVEVVTWKGDSFQGTLDNEPYWVKSVHAGSPVNVPFAKVADYVVHRADGTRSGGYSIEILQKREGSR